MSARNGDRSRYHRERKQKIARRARIRELLEREATQPKSLNRASSSSPKSVAA